MKKTWTNNNSCLREIEDQSMPVKRHEWINLTSPLQKNKTDKFSKQKFGPNKANTNVVHSFFGTAKKLLMLVGGTRC